MRLAIGSDKSGFTLKESVKKHLIELGHEVTDVGTQNMEEGIPFYDVAPRVAKLVQEQEIEKGILICGTGMGMAMVANKFKGVYAAPTENLYAAKKCRAINNANVLTMGGWITGEMIANDIVDTFLNTEFTQDLEDWRQEFLRNAIGKVATLEDEIYG